METLQDKLDTIFQGGLNGGQTDLETLGNGHVCGSVISPEFKGLSYEDRRQKLRKLIDEAVQDGVLAKDQVLKVSTLLTYTPEEWSWEPSES